jgi:hypothetical protein
MFLLVICVPKVLLSSLKSGSLMSKRLLQAAF